MKTKRIRL